MIPFIDLKKQNNLVRANIDARIKRILDHGEFIMGPEVKELELLLAEYTGSREAVACASGTDALLLALMAYDVGPGDAVLTTPFTFVATAEVISLLGAVPVFVDIDPETYTISPEGIKKALMALAAPNDGIYPLPASAVSRKRLKPRGIIAVDLFGLPADYDPINAIARNYGLFVIEDAAQSFGARYKGRKAGALGDIGCTSFFPAKPLGCYGDGGMCFTQDSRLAGIMRSLRVHGKGSDKYDNVRIGINGRLDTLQAGILLEKLALFEDEVRSRRTIAQAYLDLLADQPLLALPKIPAHSEPVWAQFSVRAADTSVRAEIQETLKRKQIPTAVYYPLALHLQKAFGNLGYRKGDFSVSEITSRTIFSLPFHPYLEYETQKKIADAIVAVAPIRYMATS